MTAQWPARWLGRRGGRPVIGLCGPDGAGKTTVTGKIRDRLADGGVSVHLGYCYGCVLCRRLDRPSGVAGAAATRGRRPGDHAPSAAPSASGRPAWRDRVARRLRAIHGHIDAGELMIRLLALRWAAARTRTAVVITDRGPLDGLAKHDPPRGSALARRYLRLASRYDLIVLLDAPADVLGQRDDEHTLQELELWRLLYRRCAQEAAAAGTEVFVADAQRPPDVTAADVVELITTTQAHDAEPAPLRRPVRFAAAPRYSGQDG